MNFAALQSRYPAHEEFPQHAQGGSSPPYGGYREGSSASETSSLVESKTKLTVSPEESVYSAILFLPAISRLKIGTETNRFSWLALLLVLLNGLLQIGVVYVINIYDYNNRAASTRALLPFSDIVSEGENKDPAEMAAGASGKAQKNIHRSFLPPNEKAELETIKDINPLCERIGDGNGTFTCMPHSVKFVHEWDNLDTNGDGVWTLEEARRDPKHLKAKLHVSPETIFNNILNGLFWTRHFFADRTGGGNHSFYLSNDIQQRRAIPKAYFQYWQGDAMMCSFFDPDSCEAAASDNLFREALHPGRISARTKGINDLDSAIQYCYRMLQPGGGCETVLPTDFKRNREQRWGRCGSRALVEGGKYTNPFDDGQSVHILRTSYGSVDSYERATSRLYLFFLSLVIMLWILALIDEVRELIKFGEFLIKFPGVRPGEKGGKIIPADEEKGTEEGYVIEGISMGHRIVLVLVYLLRLIVMTILSQFGTLFLLVETDYLNLVLNSLALTFILTIDSMLYAMVEKSVTTELMSAKDLAFHGILPTEGCKGYMLKKECWGLFLVPLLSVFLVLYSNMRSKEPVLVALRCACLQEGQKCIDSMPYQAGWWQQYWTKILPAASHQLEALRWAGK